MRDEEKAPGLAEQFASFSVSAGRDGATLYQRICTGVAGDADLLALAAQAPADQRRPNLLLAAVHFLLLSGADHPLAACYPTVVEWRSPRRAAGGVGDPSGVTESVGGDPFDLFRAFCADRHGQLAPLLASRATQTNEVGRCTALLPGLVTVASDRDAPLALLDLGASAGLNLLFDHYAYDYRPGGPAGADGSAVVLGCEVRRGVLPSLVTPTIGYRAALDRRPLDPGDPEDALWLLACQWPDHLGRFRRVRGALDIARSLPDRAAVAEGDVVDDLLAVTATTPQDAHLCILHSWVAAYLTPARQRALAGAVRRVATTRPVSWLFAEQPYEVPGLDVPTGPEPVKGATALVLVELDGSSQRHWRLADMHPHGSWLCWWGREGPRGR